MSLYPEVSLAAREWFLRWLELYLAELEPEGGALEPETNATQAARIYGQYSGGKLTGRQSNLTARPGQPLTTVTVGGRRFAVGDTRKQTPLPVPPPRNSPVVTLPTPLQPVMPLSVGQKHDPQLYDPRGMPEPLPSWVVVPSLEYLYDAGGFLTGETYRGRYTFDDLVLEMLTYLYAEGGTLPLPWPAEGESFNRLVSSWPLEQPYHAGRYYGQAYYNSHKQAVWDGAFIGDLPVPVYQVRESGPNPFDVTLARQAPSQTSLNALFNLEPSRLFATPSGEGAPYWIDLQPFAQSRVTFGPVTFGTRQEPDLRVAKHYTVGGTGNLYAEVGGEYGPVGQELDRTVIEWLYTGPEELVIESTTALANPTSLLYLVPPMDWYFGVHAYPYPPGEPQSKAAFAEFVVTTDMSYVYWFANPDNTILRVVDRDENGIVFSETDPFLTAWQAVEGTAPGTVNLYFEVPVTLSATQFFYAVNRVALPALEAGSYTITERVYLYSQDAHTAFAAVKNGNTYEARYQPAIRISGYRELEIHAPDPQDPFRNFPAANFDPVPGGRYFYQDENGTEVDGRFQSYGQKSFCLPLPAPAQRLKAIDTAYHHVTPVDEPPIRTGPHPSTFGYLADAAVFDSIPPIDMNDTVAALTLETYEDGSERVPIWNFYGSSAVALLPAPDPLAYKPDLAALREDAENLNPWLFEDVLPEQAEPYRLNNPVAELKESTWFGITFESQWYVADAFRADVYNPETEALKEKLFGVVITDDGAGTFTVHVSVNGTGVGSWSLWDFFPAVQGSLTFLDGSVWPPAGKLPLKPHYHFLHPEWPFKGAGNLYPFRARVRNLKTDKLGQMFTTEAKDAPVTLYLESFPDDDPA